MKGRISPELARILRDENARAQLRQALINSVSGQVTVDGDTYQVMSLRKAIEGRTEDSMSEGQSFEPKDVSENRSKPEQR